MFGEFFKTLWNSVSHNSFTITILDRWYAMLVPIIPPPTITVSALSFHSFDVLFGDGLHKIEYHKHYVLKYLTTEAIWYQIEFIRQDEIRIFNDQKEIKKIKLWKFIYFTEIELEAIKIINS